MILTKRCEVARDDVQVKLDAKLVRAAKQVAIARDVHLAEYLSNLLLPLVMADLAEEMKKQGFVPASPTAEEIREMRRVAAEPKARKLSNRPRKEEES